MSQSLRVVTVTCSFPNPREPGHSPFVRARLVEVSKLVELKIVAPVPFVDYGNPKGKLWQSFSIPAHRRDGDIDIFHPRWFYPPFGTPWNILFLAARVAVRLARLRRTYNFELIDSHFGFPDGVAAVLLGKLFGRPAVLTLRGNELVYGQDALRRRCMSWAFRRAAAIITVSEELRQFAIRLGADPDRCTTIPNGIDTSMYYRRDPAEARREFDIPPQTKLVVSAGGLGPGKGHQVAIEALVRLGPDTQLLIAGSVNRDGRFEKELIDLIATRGLQDRVRLLGHVPAPRLAVLVSAADVFCLASFSEGWPNVVHEAMACGTPVVGTAVGGIPEMVGGGERGFTVPVNDPGALAQALDAALKQQWDHEAIARWGQSRTWGQVAAEVVAVFEKARG